MPPDNLPERIEDRESQDAEYEPTKWPRSPAGNHQIGKDARSHFLSGFRQARRAQADGGVLVNGFAPRGVDGLNLFLIFDRSPQSPIAPPSSSKAGAVSVEV